MKGKLATSFVVLLLGGACAAFYFGIVRRVPVLKSIQLATLNELHTETMVVVPNGNSIHLLLGHEGTTNIAASGFYTIRDQAGTEWTFEIDPRQTKANWLAEKGLNAVFLTSDADYPRLEKALIAGKTYTITIHLNSEPQVSGSLWLFYTQRAGDGPIKPRAVIKGSGRE